VVLAGEAAPSVHEEYDCSAVVGGEDAMTQLVGHAVVEEASEAHIAGSVAVPEDKAVVDMAVAGTIAEDNEACEVEDSTEPVDGSMPDAPVEGRHIDIRSAVCQDHLGQASWCARRRSGNASRDGARRRRSRFSEHGAGFRQCHARSYAWRK
jgi:hypothetical protein